MFEFKKRYRSMDSDPALATEFKNPSKRVKRDKSGQSELIDKK